MLQQFSFSIFHGRNGQRNTDKAAMLALPNRLKMIDPLSSPDTGQNHAFFVKPVWWNNYSDGLANRLFRRVVEEALRTLIPTGDDAVQVRSSLHSTTQQSNASVVHFREAPFRPACAR
jgi:hypothetical protein